ncbi:small nuclear ribonucleoprotein U2, A [Polychaeton citri CBS 116435]|uniref:U2 small nuclear ribonucleoprotein A' n=1 Tax=Polychaeton citri CBS 116435 TaxID=1314669 RepID=A0A9P4QFG8_9PEZI|nr:small nuclear ribonucleoprotein U2, A [Polychaeton citri CBS 116435]
MRLTAALINDSLSYLNPLKERELDLRGHKIPNIENLGAAPKDQECFDFTDNDITALANFPLMPRLQTLLCARNRISTIQSSLSKNLPNLATLVLTQNNLSNLADLDPLQGFAHLTHVSLAENPVTSKENYRYYILWRAPQIRFLDFTKVKDAERERANALFGTFDSPTDLAKEIMASKKSGAYVPAAVNGTSKANRMQLTEKEKAKLEALIRNARSLTEIQRLEKYMAEGRVPPGIMNEGDAMDET